MRAFGFVTVDVFTEWRFGGNPLAVFPDAWGLTSEEMQDQLAQTGLPPGLIRLGVDFEAPEATIAALAASMRAASAS